jgi:hypothetical protein
VTGPVQATVGLPSETVPDTGVALKAIGPTNNANIPATLHNAINASRIRSFAELGPALAKLWDMTILLKWLKGPKNSLLGSGCRVVSGETGTGYLLGLRNS